MSRKEKAWDDLYKRLRGLNSAVDVGVFGGRSKKSQDLVTIAAANEYGTTDGHIPARPFIRGTLSDEKTKAELDVIRAKIAKGIAIGRITKNQGLDLLGSWLAAAVQKYMVRRPTPFVKNAPSTIAKKGSNRPLIDTGHLRQSITWRKAKK